MELWQLLGDLHPKLVQFPLVLLLVGLLLDAGGLIGRSARAHWAAVVVSALGTVGLLFAFICGIYAEVWAGRAGVPQHPIELHELMANIASWGFVVLLAWRIFLNETMRGKLGVYVAVGLTWYVLLAVTGWLGGKLVFEYGTAVTGARADVVLTMSDLNTLSTRQTDKNLWYSEWMHHIFGWMTLGLAASLLAQAVWPKYARKMKWIVPAFLLAGGVFLFFMADRDLYRLTDWRQFRDREVQLHKTLAIIMGTLGAGGLWRIWKRETRNTKRETNGAAAPEVVKKESNSKLVAVLALIGGSMLFTHVHTVAPYANVAAGVYIAHVVMGLTALSIGLTRLIQDWVPAGAGGWKRGLAVAFGGLMAVESVLLITYNEGLPWFIGYGRYNRWGPGGEAGDHSVTIAPFGGYRASLAVDVKNGVGDVRLLNKFTEEKAAVALDEPPVLVIQQGYQEMALPLEAVSGKENEGVYRVEAEILRRVPAFGAKLRVVTDGRREVGYFDPWVTPVIAAVPPNEVAGFECPMHEGMRRVEAGACPLCGMEMMPIRAARSGTELHDAGYELRASGGRFDEKEELKGAFLLQPVKDGKTVEKLAIMHEQPMHLIVVSEDLGYFDHVHPVKVERPDLAGWYAWGYTFPREGRYVLFADYTPKGDRAQVFRQVIRVEKGGIVMGGDVDAGRPLMVDAARSKMVAEVAAGRTAQDSAALDLTRWKGGSEVMAELVTQPRTLTAGMHAELLFRLSDGAGRPVVDLKPYLGAMGHCVVISEDTGVYLHSHPVQLLTPVAGDRGGPEVAFHTLFPKAGRYRVWAQFKRPGEGGHDRLVIAMFTVEAKESWVPAGVVNFLLNE